MPHSQERGFSICGGNTRRGDDFFDARCQIPVGIDNDLGLRDWLESRGDLVVEVRGTVRCDVLAEIGGEALLRRAWRADTLGDNPRIGNRVGEVGYAVELCISREDATVENDDSLRILAQHVARR